MQIGVKSTALYLQEGAKPWLAGFSSVMVSCLTLTGVMADQTWPYFLGVGGVAAHLAHQVIFCLLLEQTCDLVSVQYYTL